MQLKRIAVIGTSYSGKTTFATSLAQKLNVERIELDGFFKSHGVYEDYTMEDFEAEQHALKELGF